MPDPTSVRPRELGEACAAMSGGSAGYLPGRLRRRLVLAALALGLVGLCLFVRRDLDRAGEHLSPFLQMAYKDKLPEIHALKWWQLFLPIKALTGSWCTSGLLVVHGLETLIGSTARVYYLLNAVLVLTAFALSWNVFRSYAFTITLSLCLALNTFNHHVYVCPGAVALPLVLTYLLLFLFCQYKLLQPGCRFELWVPLCVLSLLAYLLSYEGWLDCVFFMWLAYPFLFVLLRRAGDRRAWVAAAVLGGTTAFALAYVFVKTRLGNGQVDGSESDVVFNYGRGRSVLIAEDVLSNFFTLFFTSITSYAPPELFSFSVSLWKLGPDEIVALQHGYHAPFSQLVVYNHVFLWRYYAGFALAGFLLMMWRSARSAWKGPTAPAVCCFLFLLMTLAPGFTHTVVKYRPMHSVPLLGYHSYVGVVGFCLLLSYATLWLAHNLRRRKLAYALVALVWLNIGYCALARPALLSSMGQQCGFPAYPDAMANFRALFGR